MSMLSEVSPVERCLAAGRITAGVLVWNDVVEDGRSAFYHWHNGEHMPERMGIPGFVRGRRYANPAHSPEWFTLYEAASLDVLVSSAYLARLNNPTPATRDTLQFFRNTARSVCQLERAQGVAVGGHAVVLRFDRTGAQADLARAHDEAVRVLEDVERLGGVVSTSLYGADASASFIDTAESKTRQFDVPQLVLLIEASHRDAAEQALRMARARPWADFGLAPRDEVGIFQLEVCFG